ncbi:ABC transporter permease [Microbacterium sp. YY-01]|uniref:ABC transporter permease n=1 Tax=Microbacterium sp. YY-01 TaxID=3421634 RepID=UPI003D165EE0
MSATLKRRRRAYMKELRFFLRDPILVGIVILMFAVLGVFVGVPIYKLLQEIFTDQGGFNLGALSTLFSTRSLYTTFWNSIVLGVASAVLSTLIGLVFAYGVTRVDIRGKSLFNVVAIFPIVSPPFVLSMALILLFGRSGIISKGVFGITDGDIYGLSSLIIIQSISFFPIAYMNLKGLFQTIDNSIEDSAFVLGASRWQILRTVTLPLVIPGILSSLLLTFIKSIEDFGNPMIIGGKYNTLAVQAYFTITGLHDQKTGSLLALSILVPALTAFAVHRFWMRKRSYATVTGKPARQTALITDPSIRVPVQIFCTVVSVAVLALYAMILYGSVVKLWGVNYSLTLEHFAYIFEFGLKPVKDTLLIALMTAPLTVIVGVVIAFLQERRWFPGKRLMDAISVLLFAIPGTAVGIGYVLSFNTGALRLTGTAAIIVFAMTFKYMNLGIEAGRNALSQIDSSIEEASTMLGASGMRTFWSVTLPLIRPALFSGAMYAFVRAMTSISAVIFLVSAGWNLMTVTILSYVEAGRLGIASAYVAILLGIVAIVYLTLNALLKQSERSVR